MSAGARAVESEGQGATLLLSILFLLMCFNFVDRQIVVPLLPLLKDEWAVSDGGLGFLVSAASLVIGLGTSPLAYLADRWSRVGSIVAMATIWSLATIASGFAQTYEQLLAARFVVGLGEAAFAPVGASLLASSFSSLRHATVIGGLGLAAAVGSLAGVLIGGIIAECVGWRAAFWVAGVPGLVVALGFLLAEGRSAGARQPGKSATDGEARPLRSAMALLRTRASLASCLGNALQLIVVSALVTWLPTYLQRYHGAAPQAAAAGTAAIVLLQGAGFVLIGAIGDRMSRNRPEMRLAMPAFACTVAAALLLVAFLVFPSGPIRLGLIGIAALSMTGTPGAVSAVAIELAPVALRSTAASMVTLFQNLLGLAVGPFVTGALADRLGLEDAMRIVPCFGLVAAAVLWGGSQLYAAEIRKRRGGAQSSSLARSG